MNAIGDRVAITAFRGGATAADPSTNVGLAQIVQLENNDWNPIWETLIYPQEGRDPYLSVAMNATGDAIAIGALNPIRDDDAEIGLVRIYRMPQQATAPISLTHTVTQATIDPEADADGDGVLDVAETSSGAFVDATDTGTNPRLADSDGDGVKDGVELADQTDPNDSESYNFLNSGLVAYYPFNGNANDESGNGRNGEMLNGGVLTVDRNGVMKTFLY